MNKCVFMCLALVCSTTLFADEQIDRAIDDVMRFSCLTNYATAHSVPEWGCPAKLLVEPSFTNLVQVVRERIDNVGVSFACGMTNDVRRRVFIAALSECGEIVYTNAVVRWFGGEIPASVSPEWMERYVFPATTRMEGYCSMHYDAPPIKKVWQNIKTVYLMSNDTENAAWVDEVLAGEAKEWIELMEQFEKEGAGGK